MRWLDSITNAMNVNLGKLWEVVRDRDSLARCSLRGSKELDVTGQLNNKELIYSVCEQRESGILRQASTLFQILFPFDYHTVLSRVPVLRTVGPCRLSLLYISSVYVLLPSPCFIPCPLGPC